MNRLPYSQFSQMRGYDEPWAKRYWWAILLIVIGVVGISLGLGLGLGLKKSSSDACPNPVTSDMGGLMKHCSMQPTSPDAIKGCMKFLSGCHLIGPCSTAFEQALLADDTKAMDNLKTCCANTTVAACNADVACTICTDNTSACYTSTACGGS